MKDYPELPVADPRHALQIISASDHSRAQKLLATALVTQARSFVYQMKESSESLLVLDVTHFLNHRINTKLIMAIGEELASNVSDLLPDVILTAPSSGNIPSVAIAQQLPMLPDIIYAPKGQPITISDAYTTQSRSYTHGTSVPLVVAKGCLSPGTRVLMCDNFLDTGKTTVDLLAIIRQSGAIPVGCCYVIEKPFMGREEIRRAGFADDQIHSLITIESMKEQHIKIKGYDYWFALVRP